MGRAGVMRTGLKGALIVAGLVLAVLIGGDLAAERFPGTALAVGFRDARALSAGAEADLKEATTPSEIAAVEAQARAALRRAPYDVRALRVLGMAAQRRGDFPEAVRLMELGSSLSLRDSATQVWLFEQGIAQRRYRSAFRNADALLRRTPSASSAIFPAMIRATGDPAAIGPLVETLSYQPSWRPAFLVQLGARAPTSDAALQVLVGLSRGKRKPTTEELTTYFARMLADGRHEDSYRAWERIRGVKPGSARSVYDGEFNGAQGPAPFNWTITGGVGATIEVGDAPERPGDRALRVEYDGYSSPKLLWQMLVLTPGRYRLEGQSYAPAAQSDDRLVWIVQCTESGATLGRAPLVRSMDWKPFATTFEVPSDCGAQRLELQTEAGDRRVSIEAWYDKLRIIRDGAAS